MRSDRRREHAWYALCPDLASIVCDVEQQLHNVGVIVPIDALRCVGLSLELALSLISLAFLDTDEVALFHAALQ